MAKADQEKLYEIILSLRKQGKLSLTKTSGKTTATLTCIGLTIKGFPDYDMAKAITNLADTVAHDQETIRTFLKQETPLGD